MSHSQSLSDKLKKEDGQGHGHDHSHHHDAASDGADLSHPVLKEQIDRYNFSCQSLDQEISNTLLI
jgi:hypothetical protein